MKKGKRMKTGLKVPRRQVLPGKGELVLQCGTCGEQAFEAHVRPEGTVASLAFLNCTTCKALFEVDGSAELGRATLIPLDTLPLRCLLCDHRIFRVHVHTNQEKSRAAACYLICGSCSNLFGIDSNARLGGTGEVDIRSSEIQPSSMRPS